MEAKPVGRLPWQPHSEVRGNLAIGNLRENIQRFLRTERGVHAETLLTAMGALTGFAAQHAALVRVASLISDGKRVPPNSVALLGAKSGERYLAGDWINAHLFNEAGSFFPLWGFIAATAVESGVLINELADTGEMARYVAKSLGSSEYGKLRAPAGHQPALPPNELVRKLWPAVCQIIELPLPQQFTKNEPPLNEIYWPIILSMVTSQFIKLTKDVVDPRISFVLAMESAIISAKLDPDRIEPGKWEIRAAAGLIEVRRIRN